MSAEPKWRNWQTRRTQNPVAERPCGFDPRLRHLRRRMQRGHVKYSSQVITDGQAGTLPNLSLVIPCCGNSQHNGDESTLQGDNWIGQVVSAVMHGPQWRSTAIFITYDDCGCFYDHVLPPAGQGVRVPMV